jgi:hypothetical protein
MQPTFVIAGGQRCGTTSLANLLGQHPRIYMARPIAPEPKYFLTAAASASDRRAYLAKWFADTGRATAAGEKSAGYLYAPHAPARMRQEFPGLRAVIALRHPTERAVSNYRYSRANGLEPAPIEEAFAEEELRVRRHPFPAMAMHPWQYVARGHYAPLVERYFRELGRERVCVVLFDDLAERPLAVCRELFAFLEVDDAFVPSRPYQRHNRATTGGPLRLSRRTVDRLAELYRPGIERLESLLDRDLSAWKKGAVDGSVAGKVRAARGGFPVRLV